MPEDLTQINELLRQVAAQSFQPIIVCDGLPPDVEFVLSSDARDPLRTVIARVNPQADAVL